MTKPWKGRYWSFGKSALKCFCRVYLSLLQKNTAISPNSTQWKRKRGACAAYRECLKATRSGQPRGLWTGRCGLDPGQKALWNMGKSSNLTIPGDWPGCRHLRRPWLHQSFWERHWGKESRGGSTRQAHREPAEQQWASSGCPTIIAPWYSQSGCAKTAWMCQDFSDRSGDYCIHLSGKWCLQTHQG